MALVISAPGATTCRQGPLAAARAIARVSLDIDENRTGALRGVLRDAARKRTAPRSAIESSPGRIPGIWQVLARQVTIRTHPCSVNLSHWYMTSHWAAGAASSTARIQATVQRALKSCPPAQHPDHRRDAHKWFCKAFRRTVFRGHQDIGERRVGVRTFALEARLHLKAS